MPSVQTVSLSLISLMSAGPGVSLFGAEALAAENELRRRALARLQKERVALPDVYKSSQGVPSGSPV